MLGKKVNFIYIN